MTPPYRVLLTLASLHHEHGITQVAPEIHTAAPAEIDEALECGALARSPVGTLHITKAGWAMLWAHYTNLAKAAERAMRFVR